MINSDCLAFLSRGGRLEQAAGLRRSEEELRSGAGICTTFRRSPLARAKKANDIVAEQGSARQIRVVGCFRAFASLESPVAGRQSSIPGRQSRVAGHSSQVTIGQRRRGGAAGRGGAALGKRNYEMGFSLD
ncbi:unnamed protein product [Linum trigynum]|uniref:Uncharacterized protein n=1 Tax=Linum trigynum TaxID=586398 RepID=A0AAV2G4F7_9ROSI